MDDVETGPQPEVAQLRAERDRLEQELRDLRHRRGRRWSFRKAIVVLLVVATCVSFVAAVPGVWASRNFLDTDRFVSRVGPLIDEPAVQDALAFRLTTQLMVLVDPQELFEEALPERGQILAVPLANAVEGFVADRVESFVASDRFAELWESAARIAHRSSVDLLRGRSGEALTIEEGQVTLNLLPAVDALLREIGEASPEILGREVDIPELSVEDIPTSAIVRLEDALEVDLDDDFGQFVVYDDDQLAAVQDAVDLFDQLVLVLLPLSVVFAGVALWLSPHRRRTLLQIAGGVGVGMVLIRRVVFAVEDDIAALPPTEAGRAAAALAVDSFLDPLVTFAAWTLGAVAVVAVIAVLTGSYPWVVSLRARASGLARSFASAAGDRGKDEATVAWVRAHRDALLLGGALVGLVVLWTADLSWLGLALVLALVGGFELLVLRMTAPPPTTPGGVAP
jgi:hypothetical protein